MLNLIAKVVFALFAVLGLVEMFRRFLFWLLRTKNPGKFYLIVSIRGHEEEAELILRSACERLKWLPDRHAEMILVDSGMDQETRKICEMACCDLPEIHFCRPDEMNWLLSQ